MDGWYVACHFYACPRYLVLMTLKRLQLMTSWEINGGISWQYNSSSKIAVMRKNLIGIWQGMGNWFLLAWLMVLSFVLNFEMRTIEVDNCFSVTDGGIFRFNSLAPGGFENIFQNVFFKLISWIDTLSNSCETALRSMPQNPSDDKSTLVQVMAWCRQAASHYLSQCCPRSLSPYGVTRPQWVNVEMGTIRLNDWRYI